MMKEQHKDQMILAAEAKYTINLHNQVKGLYQVYTFFKQQFLFANAIKNINSKQNTLK